MLRVNIALGRVVGVERVKLASARIGDVRDALVPRQRRARGQRQRPPSRGRGSWPRAAPSG